MKYFSAMSSIKHHTYEREFLNLKFGTDVAEDELLDFSQEFATVRSLTLACRYLYNVIFRNRVVCCPGARPG